MGRREDEFFKKIVLFLVCLTLILSATLVYAKTDNVLQNNKNTIKFNLNIDNRFVTYVNGESNNKKGLFGDELKDKLGYTGKEKANLDMNLIIDNSYENTIDVTGEFIISIDSNQYKFDANGTLNRYTLTDGKVSYYGPLFGTVNTKDMSEQVIVGLYFNPGKNNAYALISIGTLGPKGIALLQFGQMNDDINFVLNEYKNYLKQDENIQNNKTSNNLVSSSTTYGDYNYKNSASSYWISDSSGYWWYDNSPSNSEILNYTGNNMIIMDVFSNINKNSVINRIWTNTNSLKTYLTNNPPVEGAPAPNVFVYTVYSWFGSSQPNINITNMGPQTGSNVTLPYWATFAAHFIPYGDTIVELFDKYFTATVNVGELSSVKKHDSSSNRTYNDGLYVKRIDKQADLLSNPSSLIENARQSGGLNFNFDFSYYASNKSLQSGA